MLAIGAAAFFAGRMTQSKSDTRAETNRAPSVEEQAAHVTREAYDALHAKLTQAEAVVESQKRQLAKATAEAPQPETEAVPDPEPTVDAVRESAPRFVFEGQEEMLKSIDWKIMGETLNKMPSLLHELREVVSTEPLDQARFLETAGKVQALNGPLLGFASKMGNTDLSGTGTNGVWTHPVLVVNQVYATLAASEHKMTEAQVPQLQQIGDRYKEAEARRVASYTEDTFGLAKVIEETALRDELFAAIDGILTPEQQNVLHPDGSRGYTAADLFSSALLWNTLVQPVAFRARADLGSQIANMIISAEKVPNANADAVRAVVAEWAAALPDALLKEPHTTAVEMVRIMRVSHITACAKQSLKLRKELARRVPNEAFQKRISRGRGALVWFKVG